MLKKTYFLIILVLIILGCSINKNNQKNDFIFDNGTEKITFEILSGHTYLKSNLDNEAKFIFENIDKSNSSIAGSFLKVKNNINAKENELFVQINPNPESITNDKLNLFVTLKTEKGIQIWTLKVPVKY